MFHEMRLLPEPVQAEDTLIGPHTRMGPKMNVDIGLRRKLNSTDRTARIFPTTPGWWGFSPANLQLFGGSYVVIIVVTIRVGLRDRPYQLTALVVHVVGGVIVVHFRTL